MAAPLADSELYAAYRSTIRFSASAPNMFYMDYVDMSPDERRLVDRIIADNPHVMSAFHHFDHPQLDECLDVLKRAGASRTRRATGRPRVKKRPTRRLRPDEAPWFDFHQQREAR